MATENPAWVYSCIQGALKDLDHRVATSTVARVLNENGIPRQDGRRPGAPFCGLTGRLVFRAWTPL